MYLNNTKNIGYFNTFIIQRLHCIHIHPLKTNDVWQKALLAAYLQSG